VKNPLRSNSRKKPSENSEEKRQPPLSGYAGYTNIIYTLIGTIAVAFGGGYLLDSVLHLSFPIFKIIFSFGGVILALYLVFKQLNRK